jgi:Tol biopolymer transport system component
MFSQSRYGQMNSLFACEFPRGTELVVIDRDGSNEKVLLDCGEESCVQPAWADNITVAYSHFDSQAYSSLNITTAQLYSINTNTGSNGLIFTNPGVYGINPKFSPDGNSLGYYDAGAGGIRLVNFAGWQQPGDFRPRSV